MTYTKAKRNWQGIEFEELRKKVDPKFNDAHDKLSEAYYGYKRENKNTSVTIGGQVIEFNDSKTPEENKEIFDKYHALIHHLRAIALDAENKKQDNPDQKLYDRYNKKKEIEIRKELSPKEGKKRFEVTIEQEDKAPIEKIQEKVNQLKTEGIELEI